MLIGCPREIKNQEYRVGLTPESAKELVKHGHEVWIESGAGVGIGATDEQYRAAGATIVAAAETIFAKCEMVVKVKEPQPGERALLHEGQVLYTYLHLAPACTLIRPATWLIGLSSGSEPPGPVTVS